MISQPGFDVAWPVEADRARALFEAALIRRRRINRIMPMSAAPLSSQLALALALPAGLVSPVTTALISNGSAILASLNGIRPLLQGRS